MSATAAAGVARDAVPRQRLGRFELRRLLGRGAQASVWLAHDPRLDREVALKLFDAGSAAPFADTWLDEARAVSRLTHPNIVPVFEADAADGRPYLVFEYVEGDTLAEALRRRGAWPAPQAVALMLGVLDGLAAAHAMGLVHRDLKPSNVLLGNDGRPRVMDFGIAARVAGSADGLIAGTPGYISPEAARGDAPAPSMDVFAAGLMLGELLTGRRLLQADDVHQALARVQTLDLALPAGAPVDDTLRAIVARALARDPARRHDTARALHAALATWAAPAPAQRPESAGHGTLEFLLRRMRHKSDFPAMSEAIVRIQRLATSDSESLGSLSAEILKDVALTHKLLRLVNSARFHHAGAGGISTVSRAVALIGFAGTRNLALSLVLLEHMQDKAQAALLQEEFLHALLAATLAAALTPLSGEAEEAFLGAMLANLGRLLAGYYFPDEAQQIRGLEASAAGREAREAAAVEVLGLSLADLGIGVARSWGLPEALLRCMRPPAGELPARLLERGPERLRGLTHEANRMADLLMGADTSQGRRALQELVARCAPRFGLTRTELEAALEQARMDLAAQAAALGLPLPSGRLLAQGGARDKPAALEATLALDLSQAPTGVHAATVMAPQRGAGDAPTAGSASGLAVDLMLTMNALAPATLAHVQAPVQPGELLVAGIQDVSASLMAEGVRLDAVLRIVLETLLRALGARRVLLATRDPRADALVGRFGLGEGVDALVRAFRVPAAATAGRAPDLFTAVCLKGVDTLIDDATAAPLAGRLPEWFGAASGASSFLLLPMVLKGRSFALLYAEHALPGGVRLDERELSLVRTLRNQAVMAFRQVEQQRVG